MMDKVRTCTLKQDETRSLTGSVFGLGQSDCGNTTWQEPSDSIKVKWTPFSNYYKRKMCIATRPIPRRHRHVTLPTKLLFGPMKANSEQIVNPMPEPPSEPNVTPHPFRQENVYDWSPPSAPAKRQRRSTLLEDRSIRTENLPSDLMLPLLPEFEASACPSLLPRRWWRKCWFE